MTAPGPASALIALRAQAVGLFREGVAASDPEASVASAIEARRETIAAARRVILVAFGKAACPMLRGALPFVEDRLHSALAVSNPENLTRIDGVVALPGGHPLPDEYSLEAGLAVERAARDAGPGDLFLVLVSGGGSALVCAPSAGITLAEKVALNDALIRSGAEISEINAVRQAFSRLKGGRLAQLAAPADVLSLILSDVPGDDVVTIASGPTAAPAGPCTEAMAVLSRYGLVDTLPASIRVHAARLSRATHAKAARFDHVENVIVGGNGVSLRTLIRSAGMHYPTVVKADDWLCGDVAEAASTLHRLALSSTRELGPVAIVAGGESTVKVTGSGKGGRNQELALRFALIEEHARIGRPWVFLSGGTDGRDGPTNAAGGIVDAGSTAWMREFGHDPELHLANNDSYSALASSGDLLIIGATGTNVADLQIFLMQ